MREREPDEVALLAGHGREVFDHRAVGAVEREDVEARAQRAGGRGSSWSRIVCTVAGNDASYPPSAARSGPAWFASTNRCSRSGASSISVARDGVEHLLRRVDVAALLEPRVPGHADARELRDLLAPQARRPAPSARGQADVARVDALPPAAQERAERVAPQRRRGLGLGFGFGQPHGAGAAGPASRGAVLAIPKA